MYSTDIGFYDLKLLAQVERDLEDYESRTINDDYRYEWVQKSLHIPNLNYKRFWHRHGKWLYNNEDELTFTMREIAANLAQYHCKGPVFRSEDMPLYLLIWDIKGHRATESLWAQMEEFDGDILYVYDETAELPEKTDRVRYLYLPEIIGAGYERSHWDDDGITSVLDFFGHQVYQLVNLKKIPPGVYGKTQTDGVFEDGYRNLISYEDNMYMYRFWKERPDDLFCFENSYNGKLGLLHDLLFMCLDEIDRVCKENDIGYCLGGGTLLGAMRSYDIIPWDDDMDIVMSREEYERFAAVAPKALKEGFFFQSSQTDKEYHSVFAKVRIDGTRFVTEFSSRFPNMHQGIFIDIFVHDHTSNFKLMQKLHVFQTLFARSMVFHKWEGTPMHFYGKMKLICKLATRHIRKTSMEELERYQEKVITKYNKRKKKTKYLYDGTGEHLRHGAFPASWFNLPRFVMMREKFYPIPRQAEKYLTYSYGKTYKFCTNASERKASHDIIEVDFGKYER